ncbi:hypothetical protein HPB50_014712 [Hyalomma asiaticum]|uniref:Uncharacterized protein n=1 Tax=Hyalomma asiaticum TaxID=266040 RepID=A0ACB7RR15_HYAAI|nr:hypothetical protein HPB50_014712 [Hyalomma asiaticum]
MGAMASALKNNDCLRTLSMEYIYLHDGVGLGQLSESLSQNRTLHLFHTNSWDIPLREISVLCKALRINKSLTLKLPGVRGSDEESLSILFSALASNRKIKRLTVDVSGDPDARTAILCRTLESAGFIEFFRVKILNEKSATEILRALTVNSTIAELDMSFHMTAAERTMTAFSDMLSRNSAVTQFKCSFNAADVRPFVEALAHGMLGNKLIVAFGYTVPAGTYFPPAVHGSVRRNGAALNRAIEFVLERREDRRCAECFEIFFRHSVLITNVMETAGMSDVEARLRVASAEERRREKYLILAGVVRRSVACWLSDVTQIDALNSDCWRVIGGYLSVTDVCCR